MSVDPVSIGAKVALTAASMAFTMSQRFEGPRLDNLKVTTSAYGTPYPIVFGYRRIDGCIITFSEELREKKVESKTKGGKYTDYKYFWTGFAACAGHEIDAIAKIRMNNQLVFDMTSVGPISVLGGFFQGLSGPVKLTRGKNLRIYLGTEDQQVDPRYAAWCEDRYGPDSATARRGVAGAMFEEIPLDKLGNVVPQISMDVVRTKEVAYLFENIQVGGSGSEGPYFSWDRSRALYYGLNYTIWDVASRTKMVDAEFPVPMGEPAFDREGFIWANGGTLGGTLYRLSPDGHSVVAEVSVGAFTDKVFPIGSSVYMRSYLGLGSEIIRCDSAACIVTEIDFAPAFYFEDLDIHAWAVGLDGTTIHLLDINTNEEWTMASPGGVTGTTSALFNHNGDIFVLIETTAILIDRATMTIVSSVDIGGNSARHLRMMTQMLPGSASFFTNDKEIDTASLATLQTYSTSSWTSNNTIARAYDPVNHALWCLGPPGPPVGATIRYLDRLTAPNMTLGDIVSEVCTMCGISGDDIDVSELTQPVQGYSTVQGQGADMIAPLLEIHDVDACAHNFGIAFRVRGSTADELIDSSEFIAEDGKRFDLSIVQDVRLPARVEFNYADHTADQQPNSATDSLPLSSVATERKKVFDLTTFASDPSEAQPLVERYLRRQWFERELGEATLSVAWAKLEPGDIKTIAVDGEQRTVRFTDIARSGLTLQTKWVRDDPRIHDENASVGPGFDGRDPEAIYISAATKSVVADIPLLDDSHSVSGMPQLYYGAARYAGDWAGAVIWTGDFAEDEFIHWNAVESSEGATWGYVEEELPEVDPWVWDRGSVIVVQLKGGTLTSVTEAEINMDATINQALIGAADRWEVVNFSTATLLGDGRWQLSGFRRGRRGTEGNVGNHAIGDEFWLASALKRDVYGLSEVGETHLFKGQSIGRDPVGVTTIEIEQEGATLKPYAPARLKWVFDGTDLIGTITRRTRLGGRLFNGGVPLSENSEAYEVDVFDGATFKRTIEVSGTNTFTYTAAMAAADGITLPAPPDTLTFQISDEVGRGFALAA